jgi:hypothetical protein
MSSPEVDAALRAELIQLKEKLANYEGVTIKEVPLVKI